MISTMLLSDDCLDSLPVHSSKKCSGSKAKLCVEWLVTPMLGLFHEEANDGLVGNMQVMRMVEESV